MKKIWRIIPAVLAAVCILTAFSACGEKEEKKSGGQTDAVTAAPAKDGEPNTVIGSEIEGFRYVGADGMVDKGYCDGVEVNGEKWVVCEGKAYQVFTPAGETWYAAAQAIAKCTNSSMTREEKLKAAFDYIKTAYLEGVLHDPPYQEMDWPVVCANDLFVYGKGDCFSYGAAYAYMAKAIGYEQVYACNTGGHGWAEVEGKYYDPEWDMHHNEYNHFGVGPDDPCDVNYSGTIIEGVEWMRVLI